MKTRAFLLTLGSALILSACGGGGGGGTSAPAPTPTPTPTPAPAPTPSSLSTITAANATQVASNAYAATASISDSSEFTDIVTGVTIAPVTISAVSPVLNLVKLARSGPQFLTGVDVNGSQNCTGGGTISTTGTVASQAVISNGDILTINATNCVQEGATLNGQLKVVFSNVTGDVQKTPAWTATMDTTFTNLTVTSATNSVAIAGDMKIAINQTSADRNTVAITGNSLQTTEKTSTTTAARTITAYTLNGSTQGTTVSRTSSFNLAGDIPSLGKFTYTVKTDDGKPFVGLVGGNPSSGSLTVTGAASSVSVTATSNSSVNVIFNGASTSLTWNTFLQAI